MMGTTDTLARQAERQIQRYAVAPVGNRSWAVDISREALRNRLVVLGLLLAIVLAVASLVGPLLVRQDPATINGSIRLQGPSLGHLFGTDHLGRDIFSRVLYGLRTSLGVSIVAVLVGVVLGTALGLLTGYLGGVADSLVSRCLDVLFGIPTLLLAIALSAVLGTGILNPIVAIAVVNIPFFARLARGPTLAERQKLYIASAVVVGARTNRIVLRHILPNIVPTVIVQATVSLAFAILIEASLGYVGLGVQPPVPSLGSMLSEEGTYLELAPHASVFPGLAIVVAVLAFNLVGDGLRDALDPMLRGVR
jgi:peptide/nickel transport system permease protein